MEFDRLVWGKDRKVSGTWKIFLAAHQEICYHIPNKTAGPSGALMGE